MASSGDEEVKDRGRNHESGKYVRYTSEQVEALEKVYAECPKPSSGKRQQLIKDHPVLGNIEPKQIKVWFQNRRCRERQRLEAARLQTMNQKLSALNKLLVEENELATKKITQLTMENSILRQQLMNMEGGGGKITSLLEAPQRQAMPNFKDVLGSPSQSQVNLFSLQGDSNMLAARRLLGDSQESVVTSSIQQANDVRGDTNTSGLLQMAEDIKTEFMTKATGNSLEFVDLPGLESGREFVGKVTIATTGPGIAARVAGIINLPATKVAELLKERTLWSRDCRRCDVLGGFKTGSSGVELIYTQMYAPTTIAPARDFCTLRYTCVQEDGGIVICERSLSGSHGGASMPEVPTFVRAEMYPSGFMIRSCQEGSIVVALDHMDLEPWRVSDQIRPLYDSSASLAMRSTVESLRFLRQAAEESANGSSAQSSAWRVIGERIATGFNEAINGFADDSWTLLSSSSHDDITVAARPTQKRSNSSLPLISDGPGPIGGGVVCVKTTLVLQGVSPSLLIRYLRENRNEWADADSVDSLQRNQNSEAQPPLPLSQTVDQKEFLELVKLEGQPIPSSQLLPRENFLLQLYSGIDDPLPSQQGQLIFAPVDAASTAETVPLLPSGFRVISLEGNKSQDQVGRTLDLTAALDSSQSEAARRAESGTPRVALVAAFQFIYENSSSRDAVGIMAGQYLHSVLRSVQSLSSRLANSSLPAPSSSSGIPSPTNGETLLLARRIMQSYRLHVGLDMVRPEVIQNGDTFLKAFWEHKDAILCVVWKVSAPPEHVFANRAGLEMMDANLNNLSEIQWDKSYDNDNGKPTISTITQVLQMGYVYLPAGVRISRGGRAVGYERAVAWKVIDEDENLQCIAFMHVNWSFMS